MIAALGTLALAFVLMVQSVPFAMLKMANHPLVTVSAAYSRRSLFTAICWSRVRCQERSTLRRYTRLEMASMCSCGKRDPSAKRPGKYLRQKAAEFHESWPDQLPASLRYQFCHSQGISYKACLIDRWPWSGFLQMHLPWPNDFTTMVLQVGGADARLQMPGWASWRQVWPDVVEPRSFNALSGVDVSDVDLMNFPKAREINCKGRPARGTSACILWKRYPDSGVTAWYWADGKLYLQATSTRYPQKVCKQSGGVPSV